ncbi:MAG: recombinase family protein [Chloroflexi bacterium]|nr:recombinase family protein [Chloroflexota bacterium]
MNKRAVIYARVSTDEQAEKGHGLSYQLEECRRYADRMGFQVIKEITDNVSGASLNRSGFIALEMMITNHEAQVVVAYTSDRLSRNYYDYVPLIGKWQDKKVELHFVDRGQSQNDLQGMISDGIFAMLAHTERLKILDRTRNGRIRKAKDDKKPVMSGIVPYGYGRIGKARDAEMIIDPVEAEVVKMIFRWYTTNEDGGPLSLRGIANRLDSMGIRPKSAGFWGPSSVRLIITNEIYAGRTYYSKTEILKDGRQVSRPKADWIPIDVPHLALVNRKTYETALSKTKRNKELSSRNRKHEYLLVGHFFCGNCNLAMYGFQKKKRSKPYYRCASYYHKVIKCGHTVRAIQIEKADQAVWNWLSSLLVDETVLIEGVRSMAQRREEELEPKREQYAYILKMLDTTAEKIRRLIDELAEFSGNTVKAVIKEKISSMESEQNFLFEEKARLEAELTELEINPEFESRITEIAAAVRERLPVATFEGMRDLLELLKVRVVYYQLDNGVKLRVSCEIPGSEEDIMVTFS